MLPVTKVIVNVPNIDAQIAASVSGTSISATLPEPLQHRDEFTEGLRYRGSRHRPADIAATKMAERRRPLLDLVDNYTAEGVAVSMCDQTPLRSAEMNGFPVAEKRRTRG
jgi:hypothetical protein